MEAEGALPTEVEVVEVEVVLTGRALTGGTGVGTPTPLLLQQLGTPTSMAWAEVGTTTPLQEVGTPTPPAHPASTKEETSSSPDLRLHQARSLQ